MRMSCLSVLVVLGLCACACAQRVSGTADAERRATEVILSDESAGVLAGVCISYTQPIWRKGYEDFLTAMQGRYTRLGNGFWTTLDTVGPLQIGGVAVAAGSYYLGLRIGKDAAVSLLLFDSRQTMQARLLPGSTPLYTGEAMPQIVVPLTFAQNVRKDEVSKLAIELSADASEPSKGSLVIRWGRHELKAAVHFELAASKPTATDKK